MAGAGQTLDVGDELADVVLADLALEARHDRLVAGHHLRGRLEDRVTDVVLVDHHLLAAGELDLGAEDAVQRGSDHASLLAVTGAAGEAGEDLLAALPRRS